MVCSCTRQYVISTPHVPAHAPRNMHLGQKTYIYIYLQLYRKDGGRSRTAPGATNFHQLISRSSYGLLLWDRAVATCQLAGHDLGGCAREAAWKEGGWVSSKHNASKNPFFFFDILYDYASRIHSIPTMNKIKFISIYLSIYLSTSK